MTEPSTFTRILTGEIPGEIVVDTGTVFAIRDINPQAPLHMLVIPKTEQYRDVTEL
uniref:HIT domain-containing protein n=1 Tax=Microbacterium sp. TaxID=51671 RepID=UPI0026053218